MPLNLASPGILIREVDLTQGRVDPTSDKIGGLVGPFAKGPVGTITRVNTENDLVELFGQPYDTDYHYETWLTASSYLAYGGVMSVIRADDTNLKNANDTGASIKIKSTEHYEELGYPTTPLAGATVIAKNPGSWANDIRVAIIDAQADQRIGVTTTDNITVGLGVTQTISKVVSNTGTGAGTTSLLDGHLKGIVTGVNTITSTVDVKVVSHVSLGGTHTAVDYNNVYKFSTGVVNFPNSGAGTTSATIGRAFGGTTAVQQTAGFAVTSFFKGSTAVLDQPGDSSLSSTATAIGIATAGLSEVVGTNKFIGIGTEILDATGASIGDGQITGLTRGQQGTSALEHADGSTITFFTRNAGVGTVTSTITNSATSVGITTSADISSKVNAGGILQFPAGELTSVSEFFNGETSSTSATTAVDWFGEQTLAVSSHTAGGTQTTSTIKWNTIADAPGTSSFAAARGARNDEIHVVVIDGKGTITGNAGTILEKHLNLSKASDAEFSVGASSYWNKYLEVNSEYIFAGAGKDSSDRVKTGFNGTGFTQFSDGGWNQKAEDADGANIFDAVGPLNLTLSGGKNYDGASDLSATGALSSGLGELVSGYGLFENDSETDVDFLLMGSAAYESPTASALATKLIAVAELRKDAVAFISPYRSAVLNTAAQGSNTAVDIETATTNVINFFGPLTSSSYAVFDSGYKYMYDRFNDVFRYVPLNGDIAGTCARNDINNFPWFSPAGTSRGTILNAVKLAYNPGKLQRDRLYSSRVNPVIFSPGSGIILFGDKTGFAKASAFDRINVRRLFIFLEDAIGAAAKDQLFEFNDEITRANFVNIVEPFLRDVQAKRGITDFVVICDETNNTAAVIDSNEFVADIYIKPARSINFIGLTFVATRTGVSFEEVIGSV